MQWKTDYEERNVTKSIKICNKVYNETAFNYTIPNYEVVKTNRSEEVMAGPASVSRLPSLWWSAT